MPCIILSTLWKKTCTVCIRTWFELDQIICIVVKYEVEILIKFSLCCFFSKACLPPMCVGSFGIPSPKSVPGIESIMWQCPPDLRKPAVGSNPKDPHLAPGRVPAATWAAAPLSTLWTSGCPGGPFHWVEISRLV